MVARRGYRVHLCTDEEPRASWQRPNPDCPNAMNHTLAPVGYLAWHAWAEKKTKTHEQERCSECGLWNIWKPKQTVKT